MSAHVDFDFRKGFILDEVRVRKLHELVEIRLQKLPEPAPLRFMVFRGDAFAYETPDVAQVVAEDSSDWRSITRLDLLAQAKDSIDFHLIFSAKQVTLSITGDDRDSVFLLFSDIREYVNNEVLSGRPLSRDVSRILGLGIMFFGMMGLLWSTMSTLEPNKEAAMAALASPDVGEKLNFILLDRISKMPGSSMGAWLAVMLLSFFVSLSSVIESLWRFLSPTNLFLFGMRKQVFERKQALKGRALWGILIAFVVSVLAGVFLSALNSGH